MRKPLKFNALASACFLAACNMAPPPEDTISLAGSGFDGRVVACSAATGAKVFIDETRSIEHVPLNGYKLWRLDDVTGDNTSYQVTDNLDNCVFAFTHDNTDREPTLSHPMSILGTPPLPKIKVKGLELRYAGGTYENAMALASEYLDDCLQENSIKACEASYADAVTHRTAWLRTHGELTLFEDQVYFNGVRLR